jgi:hypothetical protein
LLIDTAGHTIRQRSNFRAGSENEARKLPLGLPANAVGPLVNHWDKHVNKNGLRVTVLLHADSRGLARLYDWEVTDLLQSLISLLDELPCESIKLVAFNLDRQTEGFAQDEFDGDGLATLEKTLTQMEFVTIPVQSLQPHSWQNFLVRLARRETEQRHPDAVIILGQGGSHRWDKLPKDLINEDFGFSGTRFFYFKYYYAAGPRDGLQTLMKRVHGRTFDVHSPGTLARAITKMLAELKSADSESMLCRSAPQADR